MDASTTRRRALRAFAAFGASGLLAVPRLTLAGMQAPDEAPSARRFVFVIQRGAADGLHTLIPYADPGYARLRGELAIDPAGATRLDGTFALHPALVETARMYANGQALCIHAVASPYRERSHFDGQNVLETGGAAPYREKTGWLNRLAGLLPQPRREALALAPTLPLALRGPAPATSYAPAGLRPPPDDLLARVERLYAGDAQLHALWSSAQETRAMAAGNPARQDPASLGKLAAGFLARPDGPRIAMLETGGWDTHTGQAGRMAAQLKRLDALLAALRDGLGEGTWARTAVLVATEFGRTAAANGTGGTDHGTGAAALLVGGAVRGGRVLADWPGLAAADLYEGRDLRATAALDGIIATAAGECFGIEPEHAARALFPATGTTGKPVFEGLLRA
ncbi:DUF1501 domain-containing protein [Ramlibacter sp. H39-3-26]|uniref:DUF1501 domain-containing protein n=1 Tax=Curvibacter soli TaxID=3031331 RepID=UPI0023DA72D8|nr:DUF1501 domain-containing protein [Ramlibacter sp. H39-3-26]MDF1486292.1 DUF1501 domain-containing protein [Ramlibacter sp. H39-3-26]